MVLDSFTDKVADLAIIQTHKANNSLDFMKCFLSKFEYVSNIARTIKMDNLTILA